MDKRKHNPDLILSLEEHIFKFFIYYLLDFIYDRSFLSAKDPNYFFFKNYAGQHIKKLSNYTLFLDKYKK